MTNMGWSFRQGIFEHTAGLLQVRVRVKPEAGSAEAVTLSRAFAIPEYANGKLMLVDGFDLGPGRYRVDLQMGDARGWECSAHWGIQTQPKDGLPDQPLTLEPNQIAERIAGPFDDEPSVDRAVGQPLGIKILLNLSPASSLESILNPLHTSVLHVDRAQHHPPTRNRPLYPGGLQFTRPADCLPAG